MDATLERSPLQRQNLGLTQQSLDESTLAIMNVFDNTLDARSCRDETARLRNKLQLYREADLKKANELKSKNDDICALQRELSNTKHKFRDLKNVREQEVTDLKEVLEERNEIINKMKQELTTLKSTDGNFEKHLEINKKELDFLREQLEEARAQIAKLKSNEYKYTDFELKENLAEKIRRQAEQEKAHGEIWRAEAQRVKTLEKELANEKELTQELSAQVKDKSVAIEKEKLWKSKVDHLQPKYDKLVAEHELLRGDHIRETEKVRRLEIEMVHQRSSELELVNRIGEVKSELSVEKSRHHSCQDSLAKLKRQLQEAKADISFTETVKQGDVDLTGLYDEIKMLKMKNEELTAEIEKMRLLGAVQEHDNVLSYRMNPSFGRRKRAREENSSEEADNVEAPVDKELKKKLHESNKKIYELEKTNAKIISCVGEKINNFRDAVNEVLGFKVSTNDYNTFNFMSLYAQSSEDVIRFQRQTNEEGERVFEMDPNSKVFQRPGLASVLQECGNLPTIMSKTTIALSTEDTIML
ncbi:unnamed protein product [Oikopleura dioica]|uniref:Spindle assembly checkpoint component MAD1 n=1 Tax=Oikopleura dioica TaxID=34765 RepID=E4YGE0_OIKDI|nr:unnamed protein product [Oikopleura dioica]